MALSGCRHGELARRLLAGDREGARAVAEGYARLFGRARAAGARVPGRSPRPGFVLELSHHLLPDDDWLVAETARLAGEVGLPVVVTNDVRYARPEDRELHDVLTAIRHGRSVETLAELRTPSGEHYLKSGAELAALPPGDAARRPGHGGRLARGDRERRASWRRPAGSTSASSSTASRASRCRPARRPSRTSPSSATAASGGATTR